MDGNNCAAVSSPGTTKRRHLAARRSVSEPPEKTPAISDDKDENGHHDETAATASANVEPPTKHTLHVPEEYFAYRQERRRSSTLDIPDLSGVCLSSEETVNSQAEEKETRNPLRRSRSFEGYDPAEECQWRIDTQAMIFVSNPDLREDELCTLAHFHHLRRHRRNAVCYDHLEPLLPITSRVGAVQIGGLT